MQTTGNLGLKKPEGTDIVDIADLNGNMDILDNAVNGKVDKVTGKQLSTNDYTAAEKTKLGGLLREQLTIRTRLPTHQPLLHKTLVIGLLLTQKRQHGMRKRLRLALRQRRMQLSQQQKQTTFVNRDMQPLAVRLQPISQFLLQHLRPHRMDLVLLSSLM